MNREQVDQLLQGYLENRGRYEYLSAAIASEKQNLARCEANMRADIIFASHDQDGMPKPKGQVSRPTENMAVKLADGYETAEVSMIKSILQILEEEHQNLKPCVEYVDAWLQGLTERESWVIRNRVIEKKHWPELLDPFRDVFTSSGCSKDTLKRIYDNAMAKIYRMAGEVRYGQTQE